MTLFFLILSALFLGAMILYAAGFIIYFIFSMIGEFIQDILDEL